MNPEINVKRKVGIVGYGSFGKFAASVLSAHADIYLYDALPLESSPYGTVVEFDQLFTMDCLILAIPLEAYEQILRKLKPHLQPDTLIVDVCSVKVKSRDTLLKLLPSHQNLLICHPLFGPQSAADSTKGHDIIVTNAIGDRAEQCVKFFKETLGLNVHAISAEEHDRVMAYVHVLTFFVARGLSNMSRPHIPFKTPSYDMLTSLIDFDHNHTQDLFLTIQQGNPYGDEVRRELVETFSELEQSLINETH